VDVTGIHPTAIVDPRADVHPSAEVGPHAVIDGPVRIGANCRVAPFAVLMGNTSLGSGCRVHSHAVIGDEPQDRAYVGGTSFVRIGNDCVIREGATVHRGTADGSETVVGHRCLLMTNSHVGHNCVLGDDVVLVSGSLLGGYVEVGNRAVLSGNSAVHQFVRIGELAMVSGLGKITQDIPPFFMTDRDGAIVGINLVGLIRAGFTAEERREIKHAHRQIYRNGLMHAAAVQQLTNTLTTPAGLRLLAFLTGESSRGITRGIARRKKAA
jgi:UDP-N-acetylglucosamine acyltransferase